MVMHIFLMPKEEHLLNNNSLNNPILTNNPYTGYYELIIYNSDISINTAPTSLPAGDYYATLKDANGCESLPQLFSITEPEEINLSDSENSNFSFNIDEILCYGDRLCYSLH